jgi:hypothetical protein
MRGGDKKVTHARITLRELGSLLADQASPIDIPVGEAKAGDLVTIKGLTGYQFLSVDGAALLARPDLNTDRRKPVPTTPEMVVAINRRTSEATSDRDRHLAVLQNGARGVGQPFTTS